MFKWVFRSCLAAWYDLGNGELMVSELQNNLIFKKLHCAFLHSITAIVGMSTRTPKMFGFVVHYWYILQYNNHGDITIHGDLDCCPF